MFVATWANPDGTVGIGFWSDEDRDAGPLTKESAVFVYDDMSPLLALIVCNATQRHAIRLIAQGADPMFSQAGRLEAREAKQDTNAPSPQDENFDKDFWSKQLGNLDLPTDPNA